MVSFGVRGMFVVLRRTWPRYIQKNCWLWKLNFPAIIISISSMYWLTPQPATKRRAFQKLVAGARCFSMGRLKDCSDCATTRGSRCPVGTCWNQVCSRSIFCCTDLSLSHTDAHVSTCIWFHGFLERSRVFWDAFCQC